VVDLSSLTKREADKVLATPGVCVNYAVVDGQVQYASEPAVSTVRGQAARQDGRHRSRRRRMFRAAAAAMGTLAAASASAGVAPEDSAGSAWTQVRDWVSSWFEDESCSAPPEGEHLEGAVVHNDTGNTEPVPPQPQRHRTGGKPMPSYRPLPEQGPALSVSVPQDLGIRSVKVTCDRLQGEAAVVDGVATVPHVPAEGSCRVEMRAPDVFHSERAAGGQRLVCTDTPEWSCTTESL
jgi:hypothetical protein